MAKITDEQIAQYGVVACPDTMRDTAENNKRKFDRLVREVVAPALNDIDDRAVVMEGAESVREAQEKGRAEAEDGRVTAEQGRVTAEAGRVMAEDARRDVETARQTEERRRMEAEAGRASAEAGRDAEEGKRAEAEGVRKAQEDARAAAETARAGEETFRQEREYARQTAEDERVRSEDIRIHNENNRLFDERTRVTAEGKRYDAEIARAAEEGKRAEAEGARQSAEQSRDAAEKSRQSSEQGRRDSEEARKVWGKYDAERVYVPGNKCEFDGSSYICWMGCKGVLPTDTAHWRLIAAKGADGLSGGEMVAAVGRQDIAKDTAAYLVFEDGEKEAAFCGEIAADGAVEQIAASPDGNYIVMAGSMSGSAVLYEMYGESAAYVSDIYADTAGTPLDGTAYSVQFSPDGKFLAVCGYFSGAAKLYAFANGEATFLCDFLDPDGNALQAYAKSVCFSSDGTRLALCAAHDKGVVWLYTIDAENGSVAFTSVFPQEADFSAKQVIWAKDCDIVAVIGNFGSAGVHFYTVNGGTVVEFGKAGGQMYGSNSVALSPDGEMVVFDSNFRDQTYLYHIARLDGTESISSGNLGLISLGGFAADDAGTPWTGTLRSSAFSNDGSRLFLSGDTGAPKIYEVSDGTIHYLSDFYVDAEKTETNGPARCAEFIPGRNMLVLGDAVNDRAMQYRVGGKCFAYAEPPAAEHQIALAEEDIKRDRSGRFFFSPLDNAVYQKTKERGDMSAKVYDPGGKAGDIFAYADAVEAAAIKAAADDATAKANTAEAAAKAASRPATWMPTAEQVGADPAGAAQTVQSNLTVHMTDAVRHITTEERTAWNAKADTDLSNVPDADFLSKAKAAGVGAGGAGKRTCRFVVGTSATGWTDNDCDYLCDGTDDQAEIQAAIDALPEAGGEVVVLDGTYQISAGVLIEKTNVTVRGSGRPLIICTAQSEEMLKVAADSVCVYGLQLDGGGLSTSCINLSSGQGHEISGNLTNAADYGININGASVAHGIIHHNICKNNRHSGAIILQCDGMIVSENRFDSNSLNGLFIRSLTTNLIVANNVFKNIGFTGMPREGIHLTDTDGCLIQGNTMSGFAVGIGGNATKRCSIIGNVMRENSKGIEVLYDTKMSIIANTILDFDYSGIYVTGSGHFIDSNTIIGEAYKGSMYSIQLYNATNTTVSNNQIIGKDYVSEGGSGNVFLNNRFE